MSWETAAAIVYLGSVLWTVGKAALGQIKKARRTQNIRQNNYDSGRGSSKKLNVGGILPKSIRIQSTHKKNSVKTKFRRKVPKFHNEKKPWVFAGSNNLFTALSSYIKKLEADDISWNSHSMSLG
jgi:hypothetical protein